MQTPSAPDSASSFPSCLAPVTSWLVCCGTWAPTTCHLCGEKALISLTAIPSLLATQQTTKPSWPTTGWDLMQVTNCIHRMGRRCNYAHVYDCMVCSVLVSCARVIVPDVCMTDQFPDAALVDRAAVAPFTHCAFVTGCKSSACPLILQHKCMKVTSHAKRGALSCVCSAARDIT